MFELKPDYEEVLARFEAWWECEIIDRPPVCLRFPRPASECVPDPPPREYASERERWLDTEQIVAGMNARLTNTVHFAESLPIAMPNLGPDLFAAFYGCPLVFTDATSWSMPVLEDWRPESVDRLQLDTDNFYYRKLEEMTDALVEVGRGRFIVAYTDIHAGADGIAAFRDPEQLCLDLIECPGQVKALCERITEEFLQVYDYYNEKLSAAGMPSTSWANAICRGKMLVAQSDFSGLISEAMFEEVFVPSLVRECRHVDRTIYHLDGPGALRHLDRLLDIPEIHAIQWVAGAGHDYWADNIEVFQRIQNKGRALQIGPVPCEDLGHLFEVLRPEGVWLVGVSDVRSREQADEVLAAVTRWGR